MTDEPPTIIDEDATIDSAFFGSHAGRSCYARAHRSGWVLVVRQTVAQREPPVMLRVWGRVDGVPDDAAVTPHCEAVRLFASLCSHAARLGAGKGVAYLARNWNFEFISLQQAKLTRSAAIPEGCAWKHTSIRADSVGSVYFAMPKRARFAVVSS